MLWFWETFAFIVCVTMLCGFIFKKAVQPTIIKSLKKKHVFITGGSSGIGFSIAKIAASMGADVTVCARDDSKLNDALEIISNHAKNAEQKINKISLDVTDNYHTLEEKIHKVDSENPIFMLVNCAGKAVCGRIEDITDDDLNYMMKLNFLGTFNCIKAVVPRMKSRNEGIIVITSSQAGLTGIYGLSAYCGTKFALRGLAESLNYELFPYNISVTLCLPPDTDTPGFEIEEKTKPEETKLICSTAELVQADDVAEALLQDALATKFFSTIGMEGFILSVLCAGMSPILSAFELIVQATLMGFLRLVSYFYIISFRKIIKKCMRKREELEKHN